MGKRELVALLYLSSWCLVMVEQLFLAVPRGFLQFVIVVFPDHTHYFLVTLQGSRSPDFGAEIRPHSQCQKVWVFIPILGQQFFVCSSSLFHIIEIQNILLHVYNFTE